MCSRDGRARGHRAVHRGPDSATHLQLRTRQQAPSWHHLFGTTDQGPDVFAGVVFGARRSLRSASLAGLLATALAATLGITAAYVGGIVDEVISFITNVFFVIPTIPLLIDISGFLHGAAWRRWCWWSASRCGRSRRASCAGQALTLKNRDFIMAAKVSASRRGASSSAS